LNRRNRFIWGLAFGYFAAFGVSNLHYLIPAYLARIGHFSAETAGWVLGAFYVAGTVARPFGGLLVDRIGFRRILRTAGAAAALAAAGVALAGTSLPGLLLSRALLGVANSLYVIALTVCQASAFEAEGRGAAFSLISAGGILPLLLLTPLGEWFIRNGHPAFYIWMPPLVALASAGLGRLLPEPELPRLAPSAPSGGGLARAREVLGDRRLRALLLSVTVFSLADASQLMLSTFAADRGLAASLFFACNATVSALMRTFGRRALDAFPRTALAATTISLVAAGLFLGGFAPSNLAFGLCGALFGVGMGAGFPLHLALIADLAPERLRGMASSLLWFAIGGSFFLAPALIGALADATAPLTAFRVASLALLIASVPMHFLWGRVRRASEAR
jgi:MFS family permease